MIPVTKTFLPPQVEYQAILTRAWEKGWITNRGILVKELEENLKKILRVPNIIATTNGTLPLQIAIKTLGLKGEIITTPFSYVATTASIVWENCTPVFVDIDPEYLTINENLIEAAITDKTSAILATHVFGNPCNVEVIQKIADKHQLKVVYDAAHCFGVKYKGQSVFNYGDVSTCSFHATKIFHTGEGGAIFCKDESINRSLYFHHNFGHNGPDQFEGLGINAKMSELQAAMGLSMLKYIDSLILSRQKSFLFYKEKFEGWKDLLQLRFRKGTQPNYSYFPLIFSDEAKTLKVKSTMEKEGFFPRRYFYPSLNKMEYLNESSCPIAESYAHRILCLPLFHDLSTRDQIRIYKTIESS